MLPSPKSGEKYAVVQSCNLAVLAGQCISTVQLNECGVMAKSVEEMRAGRVKSSKLHFFDTSLCLQTKCTTKYAHFRVRANNCETLVGAVTVIGRRTLTKFLGQTRSSQ